MVCPTVTGHLSLRLKAIEIHLRMVLEQEVQDKVTGKATPTLRLGAGGSNLCLFQTIMSWLLATPPHLCPFITGRWPFCAPPSGVPICLFL